MSAPSGLMVCLLALGALWLIGHGLVSVLRAGELVPPGGRIAVGLAASLGTLDLLGLWWPVRTTVWALAPLLAVGAAAALLSAGAQQRRGTLRRALRERLPAAATVLFALALGAWPLFIAGRVAVASLTNDDATFYIDAADHLLDLPWPALKPLPDGALSNLMLHVWNWRTGVPTLMAALSALTGLSPLVTLALVTPLLHALVPVGAWWLTQALEVERSPRETLLVGGAAAASAAAVFVAFQDMTSHLASLALFPAAVGALAVRRGGARATVLAGLLVGAGALFFADGLTVLMLCTGAVALSRWRTPVRAAAWLSGAWLAAVAFFPVTFYRATFAFLGTVRYRVPGKARIFPVRGWLPRTVFDDALTLVGLDPWPPWPAPWPPDALAILGAVALAAAVALGVFAAVRLRRNALAVALFGCLLAAVLFVRFGGGGPYILDKVLISASAFAVPAVALGAVLVRRWFTLALFGLYAVGVGATLSFLGAPARFYLVDGENEDRFVTEMQRLPPGAQVWLDGFGAPPDAVHDAQRLYRATLRAGLRPVRLGSDGGFYAQVVDASPRASRPRRAFALQRVTSEALSAGAELERFGDYVLREVDLTRPTQWLAAWAPTLGWLRSEREPGGQVFRWGEAQARGLLQVESLAPCVRLRAEVRTIEARGRLEVSIFDRAVASVPLTPEWTAFESQPVRAPRAAQAVSFDATVEGTPPLAQVFAVRNFAVAPDFACADFSSTAEPLTDARQVTFVPSPTLDCARVTALLSHGAGRVGLRAGDAEAVTWTAVSPGVSRARSNIIHLSQPHRVEVRREAGDAQPWRLEVLELEEAPCPTDLTRAAAATPE